MSEISFLRLLTSSSRHTPDSRARSSSPPPLVGERRASDEGGEQQAFGDAIRKQVMR